MNILLFSLFAVFTAAMLTVAISPAIVKKILKTDSSRKTAVLVFFTAALVFLVAFVATATPRDERITWPVESARITSVIDGDTVVADIGGTSETVRLIGIDAPEMSPPECFAAEATRKVQELAEGERVSLEPDHTQDNRDVYDRLLRYIHLEDNTNLNELLVREGYAFEYTHIQPYKHQEAFQEAQNAAEQGKRGLWAEDTCGGSTAMPLPQEAPEGVVKMSDAGICHAPGTAYYDQTTNFTPYDSVQACRDAGGRLPLR